MCGSGAVVHGQFRGMPAGACFVMTVMGVCALGSSCACLDACCMVTWWPWWHMVMMHVAWWPWWHMVAMSMWDHRPGRRAVQWPTPSTGTDLDDAWCHGAVSWRCAVLCCALCWLGCGAVLHSATHCMHVDGFSVLNAWHLPPQRPCSVPQC